MGCVRQLRKMMLKFFVGVKKKKFEEIAKSIFKENVQIRLSELWIRLDKLKKKTRMIKDLKEFPCKGAVGKVEPFNERKR